MNSPNKRGRGRPIGSGTKDDSPTLNRVADLILADPKLKPTTAMKRCLDARDANNQSVIRRLQVKWRAEADRYLAQAQARRAVAPARRSRTAPPPGARPFSSPSRSRSCTMLWVSRTSPRFRLRLKPRLCARHGK